jgi:hypothetical protein
LEQDDAVLGGAGAGPPWATTVGAADALETSVTVGPGVGFSAGAARAGEGAGTETEDLWKKMVPKTAAHTMIASADAIAARRMSDLQPLGYPQPMAPHGPIFRRYP